MTEFIDNNLEDKDAKTIVKYYIATHSNDDKLKTYGIYIVWKCENGNHCKYIIRTSRKNEYYEVNHDMNKGEWKFTVYHTDGITCVFSHEDVRAMKAANLFVDLYKYKEE